MASKSSGSWDRRRKPVEKASTVHIRSSLEMLHIPLLAFCRPERDVRPPDWEMWPQVGPKQESSAWYQQKEMGEGAWRVDECTWGVKGSWGQGPQASSVGSRVDSVPPPEVESAGGGAHVERQLCHMAGMEGCPGSVWDCAEQ